MKIEDLSDGQLLYLIHPLSREAFYYAARELGITPSAMLQRYVALRLMCSKDFPQREAWTARYQAALKSGDEEGIEAVTQELIKAVQDYIGPPGSELLVKHPEYGLFRDTPSDN